MADFGTPVSDEALMARVRDGDHYAFQHLLERHLDRQVAFATRVLGSNTDAEDAVQNAFLKVWVKAHYYNASRARFSTWLYRIVMNQCLDMKKKRPHRDLENVDEPIDESPNGEDLAIQISRDTYLGTALYNLPPRQRAAIVLCYFDELSNADAAQVLDVGVKALESLLSRARVTLKAALIPLKDDL